MMTSLSIYWLIAGLAVGIFVLWECFWRLGLGRLKQGGGERPELGAIQAGLLGLLGLLLGFTYSFAVGRYEERRLAVIAEANAIGTSYNLADFTDEPARGELRSLIMEYGESRIVSDRVLRDDPDLAMTIARASAAHERIWRAAVSGMGKPPKPTDAVLSAQLNLMFDLHASRLAAARERLPRIIVWMLFFAAGASMAVSGFISGLHGRPNRVASAILSLLIAAVVFVILDLNQPASGLIRVNQQPLIDVVESMKDRSTQP